MDLIIGNFTVIFYTCLVVVVTVIAFLSYKKGIVDVVDGVETVVQKPKIRLWGFALTFVVMWFFLAFANCGADYESYNTMFLDASSPMGNYYQYNIELGFSLYNYLLRVITDNIIVYNAITAFIFLALMFSALFRLRGRVHFGWGMMVFSCVFFLQFMDLKRIYLAAAICFFAVPFVINKKPWWALACVAVAVLFHRTAVLALFPMIMYWIYVPTYKFGKHQITLKWWYFAIIGCIALVVSYIMRDKIMEFMIGSRYENYGNMEPTVGVAQLVYHVPILLLFLRKKSFMSDRLVKYSIACLLVSFVVSSMGYFIAVIGRAFVYFIIPFAFAPTVDGGVYKNLSVVPDKKQIWTKRILDVCICGYFAMRLAVYLVTMLEIDKIIPYTNIFGWSI